MSDCTNTPHPNAINGLARRVAALLVEISHAEALLATMSQESRRLTAENERLQTRVSELEKTISTLPEVGNA